MVTARNSRAFAGISDMFITVLHLQTDAGRFLNDRPIMPASSLQIILQLQVLRAGEYHTIKRKGIKNGKAKQAKEKRGQHLSCLYQ